MTALKAIWIIGKMKYAATCHLLEHPDMVEQDENMRGFVEEMKELTDLIAQGKIKVEVEDGSFSCV